MKLLILVAFLFLFSCAYSGCCKKRRIRLKAEDFEECTIQPFDKEAVNEKINISVKNWKFNPNSKDISYFWNPQNVHETASMNQAMITSPNLWNEFVRRLRDNLKFFITFKMPENLAIAIPGCPSYCGYFKIKSSWQPGLILPSDNPTFQSGVWSLVLIQNVKFFMMTFGNFCDALPSYISYQGKKFFLAYSYDYTIAKKVFYGSPSSQKFLVFSLSTNEVELCTIEDLTQSLQLQESVKGILIDKNDLWFGASHLHEKFRNNLLLMRFLIRSKYKLQNF